MEKKLKEGIIKILKKEGAKKVKLFGSYARGEERKGSDIDLIVEFKDRKSLIDIVRIENKIKEKLGIKVEILTKNSISPLIRKRIEKEEIVLYG